jgi:hypothetical protein
VAKLACGAALASIDLAIKDDSGAYALGHKHHNKITRVSYLGTSEPQLGQGNRVSVVIDDYG